MKRRNNIGNEIRAKNKKAMPRKKFLKNIFQIIRQRQLSIKHFS